MRVAGTLLIIVAFGMTAYTVTAFIQERRPDSAQTDVNAEETEGGQDNLRSPRGQLATLPKEMPSSRGVLAKSRDSLAPNQSIPVAINRGAELPDGFRGDTHPLLHGQTRFDIKAEWTPVGKGRGDSTVPLMR